MNGPLGTAERHGRRAPALAAAAPGPAPADAARASALPAPAPASEAASGAARIPVVVKLGGRSLEAAGAHDELAADLARLAGARLLVHGGGAEVTDWCARAGVVSRFEDGLRVTDADTLEVATAVLAGLANKRLVARLRARGIDAAGLSALDAGLLETAPHPDAARLGAVGVVTGADPRVVCALLGLGVTPVVASIGAHDGALLNLNADDAACALAGALGARALVLLSDTPGVVLGGAPRAALAPAELDAALAGPEVTGGMRPKLRAARAALDAGVARVHVAAWHGPGTLERILAGASGTVLTPATEA
jgi:acetylglutamate kinase